MKDQDLHNNLPVSPVQAAEQDKVLNIAYLGQQCDSDSEWKNDSPNISFIENC